MHSRLRWLRAFAILAALGLSGCAVFDEPNRPLLDLLDENVAPSSTAGRWLAAPVALPVAAVAVTVDAVVVRPATQIDDAWGDTVELLWEPGDQTPFRRVVVAPVMALATPVVFASDWLVRSMFMVPDRRDD